MHKSGDRVKLLKGWFKVDTNFCGFSLMTSERFDLTSFFYIQFFCKTLEFYFFFILYSVLKSHALLGKNDMSFW